ncbi:MAG: fumarylacetoacetate hydrolase family protein [Candidatus Rokubacteria bacterium]|nr:fumarylacetoacetate hydrolase family protein [Candidatus Rokubacteria bacterium]
MKIVRFRAAEKTVYGVLEGSHVVEYTGTPFGAFARKRRRFQRSQVVLLAPVLPGKIIGVGPNYREHAYDPDAPAPPAPPLYLKPTSAVCGPDDPIVVPGVADVVWPEAALAIVIKKRCRHVAPERVREHVLGFTALNDVMAPCLGAAEGDVLRTRGHDTFAPLGPCIATDLDPTGVEVAAWVNGEARQIANTKDLICPVEELIAHVAAIMTLLPGDVVSTGTAAGSGPMRPGDKVEVRIDGIGCLKNPVIAL